MFLKNLYITIFSSVCVMLIASCNTEVELCNDEVHPHLAKVEVVYDWSEAGENFQRPDSMCVIAYRIIRSWGCAYQTTSYDAATIKEKGSNKGYYLADSKPQNYDDWAANSPEYGPGSTTAEPGDAFLVKDGEYKFLTFAFMNESPLYKYNYTTFNSMFSALKNKNLSVEYKTYSLDKLKDGIKAKYGKEWYDFNPYSQYVYDDATPVYYYYTDELQNIAAANATNSVVLRPAPLTQDIIFNFGISTIGVDSVKVLAEVSGIPYKMNLMTGKLSTSKTYKMLFPVENKSTTVEGDTKQFAYTGKASVLGLVSGYDPASKTGAGILQLAVYAYTHNAAGEVKCKLYNVGTNLYNTIVNYKNTNAQDKQCCNDADCNVIHGCNTPVELNISVPVSIDHEEIKNAADDASLASWFTYKEQTM